MLHLFICKTEVWHADYEIHNIKGSKLLTENKKTEKLIKY